MKKRLLALLTGLLALLTMSSCDTDEGLNVYARLDYITLGGIAGNTETISYNHPDKYLQDEDIRFIFQDMSQDMLLRWGSLTLDIFEEVTNKFEDQRVYEFNSLDGVTYSMTRMK